MYCTGMLVKLHDVLAGWGQTALEMKFSSKVQMAKLELIFFQSNNTVK
jgi:hypothetical protein